MPPEITAFLDQHSAAMLTGISAALGALAAFATSFWRAYGPVKQIAADFLGNDRRPSVRGQLDQIQSALNQQGIFLGAIETRLTRVEERLGPPPVPPAPAEERQALLVALPALRPPPLPKIRGARRPQ